MWILNGCACIQNSECICWKNGKVICWGVLSTYSMSPRRLFITTKHTVKCASSCHSNVHKVYNSRLRLAGRADNGVMKGNSRLFALCQTGIPSPSPATGFYSTELLLSFFYLTGDNPSPLPVSFVMCVEGTCEWQWVCVLCKIQRPAGLSELQMQTGQRSVHVVCLWCWGGLT